MKASWLFLILIALSWDCEEVKKSGSAEAVGSQTVPVTTASADPGACTEAIVRCTDVSSDNPRRCPFPD